MEGPPGDLLPFSLSFWGLQSPPCVSEEGEVGRPSLTPKAKAMGCRSLDPAAGWGCRYHVSDAGMSRQLGLWEDAGALASLTLM